MLYINIETRVQRSAFETWDDRMETAEFRMSFRDAFLVVRDATTVDDGGFVGGPGRTSMDLVA